MCVDSHKKSPKHRHDPKSLKTSLPTSQGYPLTGTESQMKREHILLGRLVVTAPWCQWGIKVWFKLISQCSSQVFRLLRPIPTRDAQFHFLEYYQQHSILNTKWQGNITNHMGLMRWQGARMLSCFTHVWLFVVLWTVACQAPLSMGFSRQEYWSRWAMPSSRGSSRPRNRTCVLYISCIGRQVLYH